MQKQIIRMFSQTKMVIIALLFISVVSHSLAQTNGVTAGYQFANSGDYEQALQEWQRASQQLEKENDVAGLALLYQRMGSAYQAMGQYQKALQVLRKASALVKQLDKPSLQYKITANIASVHVMQGNLKIAERLLQETLFVAKRINDYSLQAAILNDHGNMLAANGYHDGATSRYYQSLHLAEEHGLKDQRLRVLINLATVSAHYREHEKYLDYIKQALQLIKVETINYAHVDYVLRMNELMLNMQAGAGPQRKEILETAHASINVIYHFLKSGDNHQHQRSYTLGLMGWLYHINGNQEHARELMQRASFHAQQADAQELLYRWQWQLGRWEKQQGKLQQALVYFRNAQLAFDNLNPLFTWTYINPDYSDDSPVVFHYELADLLLHKSSTEKEREKRNKLLHEVRQTIEGIRSAELQDYFRDSCITRTRQKVSNIDHNIDKSSLVIYPLVFVDRLEILVSQGSQITRYTTSIRADELKASIKQFRVKLEKRRTREYLPLAQQLYDWIIRPLDEANRFSGIDTMILIPDLALRGLPFSALHDGNVFLIERIALATSPGLQLTDQRPLPRDNISILLAGLTESVQGFPALVHVSSEVQNIQNIYHGEVLLDQAFRRQQVNNKLSAQQFNIAHIASHGEFRGDVKKSFIVTYDGKMSVNDLSSAIGSTRFRPQAIELLTLSACYTAAGDDKAALGLAGITVKAGARSALASLWPINDMATAELMIEFYTRLKQTKLGKAQALREAQLKLLQDKRYRHPGYWSPFLLIGNWL